MKAMPNTKRAARMPERGSALLGAVCFTALALVVGVGLLSTTVRDMTASRSRGDLITARYLAEAGAERALWQLNQNPSWRGGFPATNVTTTVGGTTVIGQYSVDAIGAAGTGGYLTVTARGYYPSASTPANQRTDRVIRMVVYPEAAPSVFSAGFVAKDYLYLNGNVVTDSYNAAEGPYSAATASKKGDIRVDSTAANKLYLNGNMWIYGKVIVGPGGNPNLVVQKSGNITVDTGSGNSASNYVTASAPADWTPVTPPTGLTPISTFTKGANRLYYDGIYTVNLPAGKWACDSVYLNGISSLRTTGDTTLVVNGDLTINGNSDIKVGGSLAIYVNGALTINGNGIANTPGLPKNLQIYVSGAKPTILNGNTTFNAAVYAPRSDVTLTGNTACYGSVIGKTLVYNGNAGFHYDLSLGQMGGSSADGFGLKSWQED